jgi:hypothetical protein
VTRWQNRIGIPRPHLRYLARYRCALMRVAGSAALSQSLLRESNAHSPNVASGSIPVLLVRTQALASHKGCDLSRSSRAASTANVAARSPGHATEHQQWRCAKYLLEPDSIEVRVILLMHLSFM